MADCVFQRWSLLVPMLFCEVILLCHQKVASRHFQVLLLPELTTSASGLLEASHYVGSAVILKSLL